MNYLLFSTLVVPNFKRLALHNGKVMVWQPSANWWCSTDLTPEEYLRCRTAVACSQIQQRYKELAGQDRSPPEGYGRFLSDLKALCGDTYLLASKFQSLPQDAVVGPSLPHRQETLGAVLPSPHCHVADCECFSQSLTN